MLVVSAEKGTVGHSFMRKKKLGEVLRERGHITEEQLAAAIREQQGRLTKLGEILLARGSVDKMALAAALEDIVRVSYVDAREAQVAPEALQVLPRSVAERLAVLPLRVQGQELVAVMAEPQNLSMLDEIGFVTGKKVKALLGFRSEILEAVARHYGDGQPHMLEEDAGQSVPASPTVSGGEVEFIPTSTREGHREVLKEFESEFRGQKTPAVRLVSQILSVAAAKRASDVHIEPQDRATVIRIRVDGVLRELMEVPKEIQNSLLSRIKILADMDIAERRTPQDGRFLVQLPNRRLDLRVSSLPTHYGEKIVMRLLDPTAPRLRFPDLGLGPDKCEVMHRILSLPQGMLLVTGPTGSGKTTTLYSALGHIHSPQVNIVTVEDPIEYMMEGINQVQVNVKAGLTFAGCLRSILRQDPNVIMVGEIRDRETAEIALKASQTGHLVLSTLHTNDSISAVTRLIDLGIPPFLVAASVSAIVAQRLVRKLCRCRREVEITPEVAARFESSGMRNYGERMYVAAGCPQCDGTGYRGRIGIYEIIVFDEEVRNLVRTGARNEEMRVMARAKGVEFMQDDALAKIRSGITTLDEVLRVVPFESASAAHCRACGRELVAGFRFCPYCGAKRTAAEPQTVCSAVSEANIPGGI